MHTLNIVKPGTKLVVKKDVPNAPIGTTFFMGVITDVKRDYIYIHGVRIIGGGKSKEKLVVNSWMLPISEITKSLVEDPPLEVAIEPIGTHIKMFSDIDFLGWALSYTYWLHYVSSSYISSDKAIWPQNKDHVLNAILKIPDKFENNKAAEIKEVFASPTAREQIIAELRKIENVLMSYILSDRINKYSKILKGLYAYIDRIREHGQSKSSLLPVITSEISMLNIVIEELQSYVRSVPKKTSKKSTFNLEIGN